MKKYIYALTLFIVLTGIFPFSAAHAETEANALQIYIFEQTMTVFTDICLDADALKCTISNQNADITATGALSDEKALTKTTILVDISTSMPSSVRGSVIELLIAMIERKPVNEEFRLVVFGEELTILQDFSQDRYDLATAIGKIEFNNKESKIYDKKRI